MTVFLLFLLLFLAWLPVDFWLGRKRQLKRVYRRSFPLRKSDFQLYTYGETLYNDLFADIQHAGHHIHILFFIVKNDAVSKRFLKLLMQKAQEGVEVRLLLDRIGSYALSRKSIRRLRQSGVHFSFCHKPRLPYLLYSINQRNHRKITVIDGKIGYIGGFNIGEEYLGNDPKLGNWRDYHLRLTGEGVQDLQTQFLHDWRDDTKEDLLQEPTYFPPLPEGEVTHKFVPTDGAYLQHTFLEFINGAKYDIYIGTPYFIPSGALMDALLAAKRRGVRVAVLVPEKSDHAFVREAKYPHFRRLIQEGCDVYEFLNGFFHAKILMVDGRICDIGTANFDLRSLYVNHEINCIMYESPFFEAIKKEVDQDLEASRKLTAKDVYRLSFGERLREAIGTFVAFFL